MTNVEDETGLENRDDQSNSIVYSYLLHSHDFSVHSPNALRYVGLPLADLNMPRAEMPHGATSGRRDLQKTKQKKKSNKKNTLKKGGKYLFSL